jgi:hypothetical protein
MSESRTKASSASPADGAKRRQRVVTEEAVAAVGDRRSAAADCSFTYHAYCRCNGGDYFQGEFCPFDGWSSPASRELAHVVALLAERGTPLSLDALAAAGVSQSTLQRTIVIAFGSGESAFGAISPRECVVSGVAQPPDKLGRQLR